MTFPDKLKSMRESKGLSQDRLAEILNVSRQAVTKWENGAGTPNVENLLALSDYFQVTVDELLGRAKSPERELAIRYQETMDELRRQSQLTVDLIGKAIQIGSHMAGKMPGKENI